MSMIQEGLSLDEFKRNGRTRGFFPGRPQGKKWGMEVQADTHAQCSHTLP